MWMQALLVVLTVLVGAAPAAAATDATDAEHERLSEELEDLARRQIWKGVEQRFKDIEQLGIEPSFDDYLQAAYAARELGDVQSAYERLKAAARIKKTKEVTDWLWDLDNHYGHVELLTQPSRSATLTCPSKPFDPNARNAVDAAIEQARDDGRFVGMLPKGDYVFEGQKFTVEPGVSVHIEISPKMRRRGLIDPVIIYRDKNGNPTTIKPGSEQTASGGTQADGSTESDR